MVISKLYEKNYHVLLDRLIVNNCTLVGAAGTPNMVRKVLDLISNGHTTLKPMITDRFAFKDVQQAFDAVFERNESRVKILVAF